MYLKLSKKNISSPNNQHKFDDIEKLFFENEAQKYPDIKKLLSK
ncbi:MAG: hypothetical protein N3A71_04025 [Candidatus Dojkabacteria bacterium]|nr:hypothetical protein [Candidatus Dojkabacteria bacterium]